MTKEMLENVLRFDFLKAPGRHACVLFPMLFFLALVFPPLLLFILVLVLGSLAILSYVAIPVLLSAPSRFDGRFFPRSPPF